VGERIDTMPVQGPGSRLAQNVTGALDKGAARGTVAFTVAMGYLKRWQAYMVGALAIEENAILVLRLVLCDCEQPGQMVYPSGAGWPDNGGKLSPHQTRGRARQLLDAAEFTARVS
jgi:hypothetical protein